MAEDKMDRIIITKSVQGLYYMQVCAEKDVTDEEILTFCNKENPSGTPLGWDTVIQDDKECPRNNPVVCLSYPERLHFLISC